MSRGKIPYSFATLRDLGDLGVLGVGGLSAALTPAVLDGVMAELLTVASLANDRTRLRTVADRIETGLPERCGQGERIARQLARMRMEDFWGRLRGIGPREWLPEIEVEGLERIEAAKRRGRGVIAWGTRTASATAIKQGFYRAGYPLHHLSRVQHGARSRSRAALAIVGPLYCRAENRYLAGRVRIPLGGGLAYMKTLSRLLRDGQCVSIFADETGRQAVEAHVLNGTRRFATGAPALAWTEDAELAPVFCFREGPFRYRVVVAEPIEAERSGPRKEFVRRAVLELAGRLEKVVRERPQDWQTWWYWGPEG